MSQSLNPKHVKISIKLMFMHYYTVKHDVFFIASTIEISVVST